MSEPLSDFKPLDPGRVDMDDPVELQYWSQELHCTEPELMQAVAAVGTHITSLRDYLASPH
ncbi:MAG: DUF3606 domain-containing protein [Polaromonas sp.]